MANNDLITRLLLQTGQFDTNLAKSTKQVQNFQKNCQAIGSKFSSGLGMVSKFVPALAAITGGVATFNAALNSCESMIDMVGRTSLQAKTSIDAFFTSIKNGNLSDFESNLGSLITKAGELYNAMDDLGTFKGFAETDLMILDAEKQGLKAEAGKGVKVSDRLKAIDEHVKAILTLQKEKAQETYNKGVDLLYSQIGATTAGEKKRVNDIIKDAISWDNFFSKGGKANLEKQYADFQKEYDSKWKTQFGGYKDIRYLDTQQQKQYEADKQRLKSLENAVKIANNLAEREEDVLRLRENQKVIAQADLALAQKEIESQRITNKEISNTKESIDKIAEKAKKFKESIKDFNYSISDLKNGNKIELFDNDFKKLLKDLPDDIAAEFADVFNDFKVNQEKLNVLQRDGVINQEKFISDSNKNSETMINKLLELTLSAYLTQGKKVNAQQIVPILNSLYRAVSDNKKTQDSADMFKRQVSGLKDTTKSYLDSSNAVLRGKNGNDNFTSYTDRLVEFNEVLKLSNNMSEYINRLKDLRHTIKENTPEFVVYEEHINELDKSIKTLTDNLELLNKKRGILGGILKDFENINKMGEWADATQLWGQSMCAVLDQVANRYDVLANKTTDAFKKKQLEEKADSIKETEWYLESIGQIGALISNYCSLAMAAGVASGAKLPFPYNLAAITATVATIGSIIASRIAVSNNRIGKYANGGIVEGGSFSGDRGIVRVNGGEMILNGSQQKNLFRLLNDGTTKSNGVGNVEFKIKGNDLVGIIKNTQTKNSKLL